MKQKFLLLLLILLTLTSCTSDTQNAQPKPKDKERLREYYTTLTEIPINANLRTDFGDRVMDFSVGYTYYPDKPGIMEVKSPQSIAGIKATVGEGVTLSYEDTVLELGALPGTGLSPMEALPLMVSDWREGYVTGSYADTLGDKKVLCITYRSTRGESVLEHTAYFDPATFAPIQGELFVNGNSIARVNYTS